MIRASMFLIVRTVLLASLATCPSAAQNATPVDSGVVAPTADPTIAVLEKEKLEREVADLRATDDQAWWRSLGSWLARNLVLLAGPPSVAWAVWSWTRDQRAARNRHDEDRFDALIERLDSDYPATRLSAAIGLRRFLRPGYEPFFDQVFTAAIAHIRHRPDPSPLEAGRSLASEATDLNQALVLAVRESYPLARDFSFPSTRRRWSGQMERTASQAAEPDASVLGEAPHVAPLLNASEIHLANIRLAGADLHGIWMPNSSVTIGGIAGIDLRHANLQSVTFIRCNFTDARLDGADLRRASFGNCILDAANLSGAKLDGARFGTVWMRGADLTGANIEAAESFSLTRMIGIIGLTEEQRVACAAKGAGFDDSI
jgi:hypothetical protein